MEPIILKPEYETYDAASNFITTLCWPKPQDESTQIYEHKILCQQFLRCRFAADPTNPPTVEAAFAFDVPDRPDFGSKPLLKRFNKHLQIAKRAVPGLMKEAGADVSAKFPLTFSEMIDCAMGDLNDEEKPSFRKRFVNPVLPALHLGAAFQIADAKARKAGHPALDMLDLMLHRNIFEAIVVWAEFLEPLVVSWLGGRLRPDTQYRFRLA